MGQIRWTLEAERWLREIYDYIARDNPAAALRTVQGIGEKAETLTRFPERGYRYQERSDKHIRILLYGHYRIAYLMNEGGGIDILGVFHGALDIERFLS
ncbi:MAG TPA: type II toxin-antitoxin system RelE/ParE family toxin [Thermoanaerobaculia bacterium]|jgi:plasmid stabilization system protein ParE|nr:type II toxin-antitoxin system RelE/ParE family toxin [Thermoanaerobaculia bacterium]